MVSKDNTPTVSGGRNWHRLKRYARLQHVLLAFSISLAAQDPTVIDAPSDTSRGLLPAVGYSISDIENVNLASGTLNINVPLAKLPPGPGGFSWGMSLMYNSSIYDFTPLYETWPNGTTTYNSVYQIGQSFTGGGWQYGYSYQLVTGLPLGGNCNSSGNVAPYAFSEAVVFPDGGKHTLYLQGAVNSSGNRITGGDYSFDNNGFSRMSTAGTYYCPGWGTPVSAPATLVYFTADNTFARVEIAIGSTDAYLYLKDGTKAHFTTGSASAYADKIFDRNGNYVTITTAFNGADFWEPIVTIKDELSRTISLGYTLAGTDTVSTAGFGGTLNWTVTWTAAGTLNMNPVSNPNGPTYNYQCVTNVPSGDGFMCGPNANPQYNVTFNPITEAVSTITLPSATGTAGLPRPADDGILQYGFQYTQNPGWGELYQVTTPLGETAQYFWNAPLSWTGFLPQPHSLTSKSLSYTDPLNTVHTKTWTYNWIVNGQALQVTNPDNDITSYAFCNGNGLSPWTMPCHESQPNGIIIDRIYAGNCPMPLGPTIQNLGNVYASYELRTLGTQTAVTAFSYDHNGNVTGKSEYDWIVGSWSRDAQGRISSIGTLPTATRTTANTYFNGAGPASGCSTAISDPNGYWNHQATFAPLNELEQSTVKDTILGVGTTALTYDSSGNVKTRTQYTDTAATVALTTTYVYDTYGNLKSVTDPNGGQTAYAHSDGCAVPSYVSSITDALTNVTKQTWDCTTGLILTRTDPNSVMTQWTKYDVWGRPQQMLEAYGQSEQRATGYSYNSANSSAASTLPITVVKTEDVNGSGDGLLVTTTQLNQLGEAYSTVRGDVTTLHLSSVIGSDNYTYEADSQPYNPQNSSDSTKGWARKKYDANGRIVATDYFQGAANPFPWGSNSTNVGTQSWSYSNNQTTVTDESGISKTLTVDGLGRLTSVTEDPPGCFNSTNGSNLGCLDYVTSYTYDFGDRLKTVTQGAQSARTFAYDSAGRLTSAFNPETGTITYDIYDGNGNLKQKTDSRSVKTYMTYDALNRLTYKSYSDGVTPAVTYCYDALPTSPGSCASSGTAGYIYRLTEVSTAAVSTASTQIPSTVVDYTVFDHLGRVTASKQTVGTSTAYPFAYTYNWQDAIATLTYPSTRVVSYAFDASGRVTLVNNGTGPSAPSYASGILYWGHGAIAQMTQGALADKITIDARMRTTGVTASGNASLSLGYTYFANGNVNTHTVQGLTQTFTYDAVNRLVKASESGGAAPEWNQSFTYDQWGNRSLLMSSSFNPYAGITPTSSNPGNGWLLGQNLTSIAFNLNNQVVGATYLGGNQTGDLATTTDSAVYDGENRLSTVTEIGTVTQYTYDGDGRRVLKALCTSGANPCTVSSTGVSLTYYVYDAQGDLAAEYGPVTDYGTKYLIADALGSTRLVVDSSGNTTKCLDYTPFGEEIPQAIGGRGACYGNIGYPGPADTLTEKFTGKERNAETGLDYFGARYLSSAQGRFTSPDPQNQILIRQNSIAGGLPEQAANNFFSGFLENPQNWNRYTYVRNNPLSFTDPTGGAPAPGDGHHLIVLRHTILNPLARAFANAVKTGGPNPPSNVWGPAHAAYNEAEQALLSSEEQMLGSSDFWSLSQWKDFATKLLNSTRPEIKTFLDQIERELPGSRATLAGAISSFKVTPALRTQLALWVVGTDIQLLMSDIVIAVNPKIVEEVAPSHRNCLIDRDTGTCVVY